MALLSSSRPLLSAHPAHYTLTALLCVLCLVLYNKVPSYPSIYTAKFATGGDRDLTLSERLARSEELFQRSRAGRKHLTDQFGPDPDSFSNKPDGPYPPMTVYDFVSLPIKSNDDVYWMFHNNN
jgi:hypothetical protein